mgnify:CR=1 FL=1
MDDITDIERAAEMFAEAAVQDDEEDADELDILVGLCRHFSLQYLSFKLFFCFYLQAAYLKAQPVPTRISKPLCRNNWSGTMTREGAAGRGAFRSGGTMVGL